MLTTDCTSYYTTVVTGIDNNVTIGASILTLATPKPDRTDTNRQQSKQCNAVAIGGFNRLNN
jgi:hypothetical protein